MSYPKWTHLLKLYTRPELPGWFSLLAAAGVWNEPKWKDAPKVQVRGKWHGYRMVLDLSSGGDRTTYFIARYLDTASQRVIQALLEPGDTFVDIGANTGMVTLVGASRVGSSGRVHAFEPNPRVLERLRATVAANALPFVQLHGVGLSDREAELPLHVPEGHADMGTFGSALAGDYKGTKTTDLVCRVVVGDGVLSGLPERPTTIKIDVEGFEASVIRGLRRTLERLRPAVLTEVEPELLAGAGSSPGEVAELMTGLGYRGYWIQWKRTRPASFLQWVWLEPMTSISDGVAQNVVWVIPGSEHERRLSSIIRPLRAEIRRTP